MNRTGRTSNRNQSFLKIIKISLVIKEIQVARSLEGAVAASRRCQGQEGAQRVEPAKTCQALVQS